MCSYTTKSLIICLIKNRGGRVLAVVKSAPPAAGDLSWVKQES